MKTDAEIRAKWKEVLDRPRTNPHVIDTGALVIEVVRWAESGLTPNAVDSATPLACQHDFGMLGICVKCGETETPSH